MTSSHFFGYCARRDGKPVPRWLLHGQSWIAGKFELREEFDQASGRTLRVGRFLDGRGKEVFPNLLEAQLIMADGLRFVLNGFERAEVDAPELGQTWVLHVHDRVEEQPRLQFWMRRLKRGAPDTRCEGWENGEFSLREERDDWLGRTVRVARVVQVDRQKAGPVLIEATLIAAGDGRLILSGTDRDVLTRRDVACVWELVRKGGLSAETALSQGRGEVEMPPP